jgi:hypothetical protein
MLPCLQESDAAKCAALYKCVHAACGSLARSGSSDSRTAAGAQATAAESMLRLALHRAAQEQGCDAGQVQLPPVPQVPTLQDALAQAKAAQGSARAARGAASGVVTPGAGSAFAWRGAEYAIESDAVREQVVAAQARAVQAREAAPDSSALPISAAKAWTHCSSALEEAVAGMQTAAQALVDSGEAHSTEGLHATMGAALEEVRIERFVAQALAVSTLAATACIVLLSASRSYCSPTCCDVKQRGVCRTVSAPHHRCLHSQCCCAGRRQFPCKRSARVCAVQGARARRAA